MPNGIISDAKGYNPLASLIAGAVTRTGFVGTIAAPLVTAPYRSGQVIVFDPAHPNIDGLKAPDGTVPSFRTGFRGKSFNLQTFDLDYKVDEDDYTDAQYMSVDWDELAATELMNQAYLNHELKVASLFTTAANYVSGSTVKTLSGSAQFNDASSSLRSEFDIARRTGQLKAKRPYNAIIGSTEVMDTVRRHPEMIAQFYQSDRTTVELADVASFARVEVAIEASAITTPRNGTESYIWGKDLIFTTIPQRYVDAFKSNGTIEPLSFQQNQAGVSALDYSAAYTYARDQHPLVRAEERTNRDIVWGIDLDCDVVSTGVDANDLLVGAYLIKDAVA